MKAFVLAIVAAVSFTAAAQKNSQDWFAQLQGDEYYWAATFNDSGGILGQWCYFESQGCMYLVATNTACESDAKYPILANSDAGAVVLEIVCRGSFDSNGTKKYRYVFTDFDSIDGIVRKAIRVGFAMPLKDGYFNVVRFTLASSNGEIDRMRAAASQRMSAAAKKSTRDTRL